MCVCVKEIHRKCSINRVENEWKKLYNEVIMYKYDRKLQEKAR